MPVPGIEYIIFAIMVQVRIYPYEYGGSANPRIARVESDEDGYVGASRHSLRCESSFSPVRRAS